jgi:hypothetical protein
MELTRKDLANFYNCSLPTAKHREIEIKQALNITHKGRILDLHLAKYEGLTLNDIYSIFGLYSNKKQDEKRNNCKHSERIRKAPV